MQSLRVFWQVLSSLGYVYRATSTRTHGGSRECKLTHLGDSVMDYACTDNHATPVEQSDLIYCVLVYRLQNGQTVSGRLVFKVLLILQEKQKKRMSSRLMQ